MQSIHWRFYRYAISLLILISLALAKGCTSANAPSIGYIDSPIEKTVVTPNPTIAGWALDREGVKKVEIVLNDKQRFPAKHGLVRNDVKAIYPKYPNSGHSGFQFTENISQYLGGYDKIEIVVTDRQDDKQVIGRRTIIGDLANNIWKPLLEQRPLTRQDKFYILFGTSGFDGGAAAEIKALYAPYLSETMKVGVRVPILYMRTTKGEALDWVFDPYFDTSTMHENKIVAEDSLHRIMQSAVKHHLPVLFTLNGGIWGDARDAVPQWDLTDHLEEEPLNCQWNENNQVMADDYLQHLPGSEASPELARALTLNVYAEEVRAYKKRNLQQAGRFIKEFTAQHPNLFAGINLDPDTYINPFFEGKQWYDYNPGTVRQFREWLRGRGAYAGKDSTVDLRRYRRENPLSLKELNRMADESFSSWGEVEPPREKFWLDTENPYVKLWAQFRRHLVDLHLDELSKWLNEAGIEPQSIYSAQGFTDYGKHDPIPIAIDSPAANYDAGGLSIEGSVPEYGHLGAILYGPSARNNVLMGTRNSLFRTLWEWDKDWAVVEYNTADLRHPRVLPDYGAAYRSLRDLFNFGARFVSPMAWNGFNGIYREEPNFVAYTSYRNTPLEEAVRDFLVSHANLPRRALLWTFGSAQYADDDGWKVTEDTELSSRPGYLILGSSAESGQIELLSPVKMAFYPNLHNLLVAGVQEDRIAVVQAYYRLSPNTEWIPLSSPYPASKLEKSLAGLHLPLNWRASDDIYQIRLLLQLKEGRSEVRLDHIALYPKAMQ